MTQTSSLLVATVTATIMTFSCGNNGSSKKTTSETQRTGRSNSSVDAKYVDELPSVSADGLHIVFVSGRDGGTRRVYKSSFSSGAWSTPTRLTTTTTLTAENFVKLSPDGGWVLVQGATSSGEGLELCAFSTGTCSSVSTSPWGQGAFSFNTITTSTMFWYLSGTKSSGGTLYVADINSGSPTSVQVGTSDSIIEAFWATKSNPYTLITTKKSSATGKKTLTSRSFANATAAGSATATDFSTELSYGAVLDTDSSSAARFTVLAPLKTSASKTFTELGSIDSASKKSVLVKNELQTWTVAGSSEGAVPASSGFETISAFVTSDESTIVTLNRISTRCAGDTDSTYGFGIALITRATNAVAWRHLKKPLNLADAPTVSTDPCDKTIGTSATTYDFAASQLRVNASASSSAQTIVWSSDMTGDPEVFASITSAGSTTVYNVSANRVP